MKQISFFLFLIYGLSVPVRAQKPPVLTANAAAYNFNISVADNFNIGRRFEEVDKNLPVGSLGNMVLPADYSTRSLAQKTLFLVNSERLARNNSNYGSGALVVIPFHGVERNLVALAQNHANWLVAQNKFDHCGDAVFGTACGGTNSSASQRIQSNATLINGWERNAENIGLSLSSSPSSPTLDLANERTIYDMIFRNAPDWVHRDNFMQSVIDNNGTAGKEGFLGVGEQQGANYNPINAQGQNMGKVLVYVMYDPKTTATNAFSVDTLPSVVTIDTVKYYKIVAKNSGKVLTVAKGAQTSGAAVVQATLANLAYQKWRMVPTTGGYVHLSVKHSGQALDVKWGTKKKGARIHQWATNALSTSQEWRIEPVAGGYFKIINRNSGLSLSVPVYSLKNDVQTVQLNELSFSDQLWQIVEVPTN